MKDYLIQLSEELRQISAKIGAMKAELSKMEDGLEKKKLGQKIKDKQFQALFYIDKIKNLADDARKKGVL